MRDGIGLSLSRRYCDQVVAPLIQNHAPGLRFAAARIGYGSEVLGFDTDMSADHNYGPTLQVILDDADFSRHAKALLDALDAHLPQTFETWPTQFHCDGRPERGGSDAVGSTHGVALYTLSGWYRLHLQADLAFPASPVDFLAIPEQLLLTATAGAVYRDDLGTLTALRDRLSYLPRDIWLYKLAAQWARIGEERAFIGRTGDLGDDLGSRLIAARLVNDLMRIGFLLERQYAPYAKWFGTGFARLPLAETLLSSLGATLAANTWQARETAFVAACRLMAELQLARKVPGAIAPTTGAYHTRPFQVIDSDAIVAGLVSAITDPTIAALPLTGGVDQFSNATPILANPSMARATFTGTLA